MAVSPSENADRGGGLVVPLVFLALELLALLGGLVEPLRLEVQCPRMIPAAAALGADGSVAPVGSAPVTDDPFVLLGDLRFDHLVGFSAPVGGD